jgi:molybdate transport system ATP-binding protein
MSLDADVVTRAGSLLVEARLALRTGETVALVGPNGAGKTTLLRCLAGLVPLERGRVVLDDDVLEDAAAGVGVPTERRSIGFVFQDYLLFPHMTVLDNVAFGLRARGVARIEARAQAADVLARMSSAELASLRPRALSGGQAQRVALARALAIEPRLLLLDEPLAALDAPSRAQLRRELRDHLAAFEGTRLLVTHDPVEAIALGDRLVVLEGGKVSQSGTIDDLRAMPRSFYVADLVGLNLWRGRAAGDVVTLETGGILVVPGAGSGEVFAAVHPRAIALWRARPEGSPRNVWRGRVEGVDLEGPRARVRLGGRRPAVAEVTSSAVADLELREGTELWVSVKASEVDVYPA